MGQTENFIRLIQGGLSGSAAPEMVRPDWEELYRLSKAHNVMSLGYEGVHGIPEEKGPSAELLKRWKADNDQCTCHCLYQQAALEELEMAFEEAKIPVILLKGAVLRELYPRPDLRNMADLDVLVRMEDIGSIRKLLPGLGYQERSADSRNEDVYVKDELITLEVHRELFWKMEAWNAYFRTVWDRAEKLPGFQWVQRMRWEDFYLHLLGHMVHHMYSGGIGIKAFLDIGILKECQKEALHSEEMRTLLKKFQLFELDANLEQLLRYWCGEAPEDALSREWTEFIVKSGAYGNFGNFIILNPAFGRAGDSRKGMKKWRYLWRRLFPAFEEMRNMYPGAKRSTYLYYAGKRIYRNAVRRPKAVRKELKSVKTMEKDRIASLLKLYDRIGIPPVS